MRLNNKLLNKDYKQDKWNKLEGIFNINNLFKLKLNNKS